MSIHLSRLSCAACGAAFSSPEPLAPEALCPFCGDDLRQRGENRRITSAIRIATFATPEDNIANTLATTLLAQGCPAPEWAIALPTLRIYRLFLPFWHVQGTLQLGWEAELALPPDLPPEAPLPDSRPGSLVNLRWQVRTGEHLCPFDHLQAAGRATPAEVSSSLEQAVRQEKEWISPSLSDFEGALIEDSELDAPKALQGPVGERLIAAASRQVLAILGAFRTRNFQATPKWSNIQAEPTLFPVFLAQVYLRGAWVPILLSGRDGRVLTGIFPSFSAPDPGQAAAEKRWKGLLLITTIGAFFGFLAGAIPGILWALFGAGLTLIAHRNARSRALAHQGAPSNEGKPHEH
jgi:hypothetical protein